MKELKFSEFFQGEYEDIGYELYFLKDNDGTAMYIGISRISVWHRWFGGAGSHMSIGETKSKLYGTSYIGQVIERRFPDSLEWKIELWTRDDCLKVLQEEFVGRNYSNISIQTIEPLMITKFMPLYNVMHGGHHEDPLTSKKLDEAYKKLFG